MFARHRFILAVFVIFLGLIGSKSNAKTGIDLDSPTSVQEAITFGNENLLAQAADATATKFQLSFNEQTSNTGANTLQPEAAESKPKASANELLSRAFLVYKSSQTQSGKERQKSLEEVLTRLEKIQTDFPQSNLAKKLSTEGTLGALDLAAIRAEIEALSDEVAVSASGSSPAGTNQRWNQSIVVEDAYSLAGLTCKQSNLRECLTQKGLQGKALEFAYALTMKSAGAGGTGTSSQYSPVAIADSFLELGAVDLVQVFYPGRANTNTAFFLVNGSPDLLATEFQYGNLAPYAIDAPSRAFAKAFPQASVRGGGGFSSHRKLPDGGQRFVFGDSIVSQCRACPMLGGVGRVYDFSADGTLRQTRNLGISDDRLTGSSLEPLTAEALDRFPGSLQARLAFSGYDVGPIDGVPGRQTQTAVAEFQRANCLNATGQLDSRTIGQLLKMPQLSDGCGTEAPQDTAQQAEQKSPQPAPVQPDASIQVRFKKICQRAGSEGSNLPCPFVYERTCSGESCSKFGPRRTSQEISLVASPGSAKVVSTVPTGTWLWARRTDVYIAPCRAVVNTPFSGLKSGQTVWRTLYLGEGYSDHWDGQLMVSDGFDDAAREAADCDDQSVETWQQLETKAGEVGWSNAVRGIEGGSYYEIDSLRSEYPTWVLRKAAGKKIQPGGKLCPQQALAPLSGSMISSLFSDKTLIGHNATYEPWTERLSALSGGQGTTSFVNKGRQIFDGRWSVQGDRICFSYGNNTNWSCKSVHVCEGNGGIYAYVGEGGTQTSLIRAIAPNAAPGTTPKPVTTTAITPVRRICETGFQWTQPNGCKACIGNQTLFTQKSEAVEWDGACKDNYIDGAGTLRWMAGKDLIFSVAASGRYIAKDGFLTLSTEPSDVDVLFATNGPRGTVFGPECGLVDQGWRQMLPTALAVLPADIPVEHTPALVELMKQAQAKISTACANLKGQIRRGGVGDIEVVLRVVQSNSQIAGELANFRSVKVETVGRTGQCSTKVGQVGGCFDQYPQNPFKLALDQQLANQNRQRQQLEQQQEQARKEREAQQSLEQQTNQLDAAFAGQMETVLKGKAPIGSVADLIRYDRVAFIREMAKGRQLVLSTQGLNFSDGSLTLSHLSRSTDVYAPIRQALRNKPGWEGWLNNTKTPGPPIDVIEVRVVCRLDISELAALEGKQTVVLNAKLLNLGTNLAEFECES